MPVFYINLCMVVDMSLRVNLRTALRDLVHESNNIVLIIIEFIWFYAFVIISANLSILL